MYHRHYAIQGRRPTMEDAASVKQLGPDLWFAGVFDGHGGAEVSALAARILPELLAEEVHSPGNARQTAAAIRRAAARFQDLLEKQRARFLTQGSTATFLVIDSAKNRIYTANIGDSRAVLIRDGGRAVSMALSSDHKPDGAQEKKRIIAVGGRVEDGRAWLVQNGRYFGGLSTSRSFGDLETRTGNVYVVSPVPDVTVHDAVRPYSVLLACDGVFDVLSTVQAAKMARLSPEAVVRQAFKDGSGDNISALIVGFE